MIGAVLAGGRGRRIGGAKALVELDGVPLIQYPLRALQAVTDRVAVVAKAGTELPPCPGALLWLEPDEPVHPLTGIVHALALADGAPVLVCALDLPLVTPALLRRLATADGAADAVVARGPDGPQPLCAIYRPAARAALERAALAGNARLMSVVAGLDPVHVDVEDAQELLNVNAPEDLLVASAVLATRT